MKFCLYKRCQARYQFCISNTIKFKMLATRLKIIVIFLSMFFKTDTKLYFIIWKFNKIELYYQNRLLLVTCSEEFGRKIFPIVYSPRSACMKWYFVVFRSITSMVITYILKTVLKAQCMQCVFCVINCAVHGICVYYV